MTKCIYFALPDGRWLGLTTQDFHIGLQAGAELMSKEVSADPSAKVATRGDTDELLTMQQVARRLNLPVSWIGEATRQGRLPCHRFGRYVRYSLADVISSTAQERRGFVS